MTRITIRKRNGEWIILKNGRKIGAETTKDKAQGAVNFYRAYFKISPKKRDKWIKETSYKKLSYNKTRKKKRVTKNSIPTFTLPKFRF